MTFSALPDADFLGFGAALGAELDVPVNFVLAVVAPLADFGGFSRLSGGHLRVLN